MKLKTPSAPFSPVPIRGESITVETEGKILVLPTGNPNILPNFNEYTLSRSDELPNVGTYTLTVTELQHLIKPWIALYDPEKTTVDFFLFTHKPKKLQYTVSDVVTGTGQFQTADEINIVTVDGNNFLVKVTDKYITQLILFPGNGFIYYGQITHCDLILDSDSDLIPDIFGRHPYHFVTADGVEYKTSDEKHFDILALFDGSVTKFLEAYDMVI